MDLEKDTSLQVENAGHQVLDAEVTHQAVLHTEVTDGKTAAIITAQDLADDQLLVSEERAQELKERMSSNKLVGYLPVTEEEIAMNKMVNRKMDLVVGSPKVLC